MDHDPRVLLALMTASESDALSLETCFGQLMDLSVDQLRDLPGTPQQVMLSQTLFFLRTRVRLLEYERNAQVNYSKLMRILDVVERALPAAGAAADVQ